MKEVTGNIWAFYGKRHWVVITTNGTIKTDGSAVMGRGVALEAKQRLPSLPFKVGKYLEERGNHCGAFWDSRLITFPVKHNWYEKASTELIERSCRELSALVDEIQKSCLMEPDLKKLLPDLFYLVRPGCGNGQLDWKDVKPILEKYLDDRFVVVNRSV